MVAYTSATILEQRTKEAKDWVGCRWRGDLARRRVRCVVRWSDSTRAKHSDELWEPHLYSLVRREKRSQGTLALKVRGGRRECRGNGWKSRNTW